MRRNRGSSGDEDDVSSRCLDPLRIKIAIGRNLFNQALYFRIICVDIACKGDDKTVAYAMENGVILDRLELEKRDTMETVGHLLIFAEKNKGIENFAIDELNAGAGVVDRLIELGKNVIAVNSARKSISPEMYSNIRAVVWGWGSEQFELDRLSLPKDDLDLLEQLKWSEWKAIESSGVLQVELKEDIIKRYGRSPDNADAYLYGLWGMQFIQPVGILGEQKKVVNYFVNPMWDASTKRDRGQYDRLARLS